jgi:hypothetical protein
MLQDQKQANQNTAVYPTNLYRNIAMDKAGVLRLQSKLVPFNPPSTSFRTVVREKVVSRVTFCCYHIHACRSPLLAENLLSKNKCGKCMLIRSFISLKRYLCVYTTYNVWGSVRLKLVACKQYPSIHTYIYTYILSRFRSVTMNGVWIR